MLWQDFGECFEKKNTGSEFSHVPRIFCWSNLFGSPFELEDASGKRLNFVQSISRVSFSGLFADPIVSRS